MRPHRCRRRDHAASRDPPTGEARPHRQGYRRVPRRLGEDGPEDRLTLADETPLDRFKSVLTGTARAIAREPELEVGWAGEAVVESGKSLRVPIPGRTLPPEQMAEARGYADAFALKQRHHSAALHTRNAPSEPTA